MPKKKEEQKEQPKNGMELLASLGITPIQKWTHGVQHTCTATVGKDVSNGGVPQVVFNLSNQDGASIPTWVTVQKTTVGILSSRLAPFLGLEDDQKLDLDMIQSLYASPHFEKLTANLIVETETHYTNGRINLRFRTWESTDSMNRAEQVAEKLSSSSTASKNNIEADDAAI